MMISPNVPNRSLSFPERFGTPPSPAFPLFPLYRERERWERLRGDVEMARGAALFLVSVFCAEGPR